MVWERRWRDGVAAVTAAFASLPDEKLQQLRLLSNSMVGLKQRMQELVARVDAGEHCSGCGGACCVAGRYHFTAADLLVYLACGRGLFSPLFDNGLCPYLAEAGCLMPPGFRPFNCITFNCEIIEDRLTRDELSRFYAMERELRSSYGEIRALFPSRTMDGPLLRE